MGDTDKSELENILDWADAEYLVDDNHDAVRNKTVAKLQALITQQCNQARLDEHSVIFGMFNVKTELFPLSNETRIKIKKRQAELQAQAKEAEYKIR